MTPTRLTRLLLLFLASFFLFAGSLRAETVEQRDQRLVAEMQVEVKALQHRMLSTDDLHEQLALQEQLKQVVDKLLGELSPKSRAFMTVAMKVVQPIMEEAGAYTKQAADFLTSDRAQFYTVDTKEDLQARIEAVRDLLAANVKIMDRISELNTNAERILKENNISTADRLGFMKGLEEGTGRMFSAVKAIRTLEGQILEDYAKLFELQLSEWGRWKAQEDHTISWENTEAQTTAEGLVQHMQVIAERQVKAQQVLQQRL